MKLKECGIVDGSTEEKYIYYKNDVFKVAYFSEISLLAGRGILHKTKVDWDYRSEDYKNMRECEVFDSIDKCRFNKSNFEWTHKEK